MVWPFCCCDVVQCSELLLRPCNVIAATTGGQWEIYDDCVQLCDPGCDTAISKAFVSANLINEMVDFSDDEGSYIQGTGTGDSEEPIGSSNVAYRMECYQCLGDDNWVQLFLSSVELVTLRVRMRMMAANDDPRENGDVGFIVEGAPSRIDIEVTNQGSAECTDDNWQTYESSFVPTSTLPNSWDESVLTIEVETIDFETIPTWCQISAVELELSGTPV